MLEHSLMGVQNMAATIFVVTAMLLRTLNWNALITYMMEKTAEFIAFKREMMIALFAALAAVGMFLSQAMHIHHPYVMSSSLTAC